MQKSANEKNALMEVVIYKATLVPNGSSRGLIIWIFYTATRDIMIYAVSLDTFIICNPDANVLLFLVIVFF